MAFENDVFLKSQK